MSEKAADLLIIVIVSVIIDILTYPNFLLALGLGVTFGALYGAYRGLQNGKGK